MEHSESLNPEASHSKSLSGFWRVLGLPLKVRAPQSPSSFGDAVKGSGLGFRVEGCYLNLAKATFFW